MTLFSLLIGLLGALFCLFLGYLAACAGAERWLTFREWWGIK
jgi:ABC-type spermidine/putrescine transport system permease subunit I